MLGKIFIIIVLVYLLGKDIYNIYTTIKWLKKRKNGNNSFYHCQSNNFLKK